VEVDFPKLTHQIFKKSYVVTNPLGIFRKAHVGHAMNREIREKASSGGVITQLLVYLLEEKKINGAVVTIADPKKPWKAKPILAKSKDEIIEGAQSKYGISPVNQVLQQLRETDGKFALVGLPCHVHAIKKLAEIDRSLSEKISPIIGLYCHMSLETEAFTDLVNISKISPCDVQKLEFRTGKWPGFIRVKLKDGTFKRLYKGNIKSSFNILSRIYYPKRCLYCVDATNEFADISVSDPWIRDKNGQYPYRTGWSMVIERTEKGGEILDMAQKDDALFLEEISRESALNSNSSMMKGKRKKGFIRVENLKKRKRPFPNYHTALPITHKESFNELFFSLPLIFGKLKFTRKLALRIAMMIK